MLGFVGSGTERQCPTYAIQHVVYEKVQQIFRSLLIVLTFILIMSLVHILSPNEV